MERTDVQFLSDRDYCAGWLYWPPTVASDETVPCVVMAHGFSLTRHDGLPYYAERFAQTGYAVLLFDYRYLGDSAGQPRQRIRICEQLDDWRNAISFARAQRGIDPDRIVLWGYSLTGGHVVAIAAQDHQVAAALVLCPLLSGLRKILSTPLRSIAKIIPLAIVDQCGWHQTAPVTGPVGARALLTLPGEAEGFAAVTSADSPWQNAVLPAFTITLPFYYQTWRARRISCPLWVGLGDRDITVHGGSVERLARRAPRGVLQRYPYGHWEPFQEQEQARELITRDQLAFLAQAHIVPIPAVTAEPTTATRA
jgi:pimeloyl-ACP methyl ester carboxylesterase